MMCQEKKTNHRITLKLSNGKFSRVTELTDKKDGNWKGGRQNYIFPCICECSVCERRVDHRLTRCVVFSFYARRLSLIVS